MLKVRDLVKIYKIGKSKETVRALNNVSIDFPEKGLVFLLGKSGSGKSTLLNAIGGLDTFNDGEIIIKGRSSEDFSQADFDSYRNTFIGFIFQEYNILEEFTVAKNLSIALELQGKKADKTAVNKLLEQVDMLNFAKRKPNQLSGGQKQRVAIARALIKNPEIIMADEPTGALDSNTGKQVMDALKKLSKEKLVIIVSHDREFAEIYGDRIIELKDGNIIQDVTKKEIQSQKTNSGLSIIDNKIVHIKKGTKLTNDDINKINTVLKIKTAESDILISIDESANEQVKKASFITENGNKETFLKTEPADIVQKQYDPKNFKLIKSKLKFKDSFKMGASALKNKVGKLVFTILLSFIAFTMFGVIDTLSTFNRSAAIFNTVEKFDQTTVSMLKEEKGEYSNHVLAFKEEDIRAINEKFPDIEIKKVTGANIEFGRSYYGNNHYNNTVNISDLNSSSNNLSQVPYISGMIYVTDKEMSKFGLQLVAGRMPVANNEIAISKHIYDAFECLNSDTDLTYDKMFTTYKSCYINGGNYTIVGIVDDGSDYSEYMNMEKAQISSDYMLQQKISRELNFGFTNMCYITADKYNELLAKPIEMSLYFYDEDSGSSLSFATREIIDMNSCFTKEKDYGYFQTKEQFINQRISYFKNNQSLLNAEGNFVELGENEILLCEDFLRNIGQGEELQQIIDNGLMIDLSTDYEGEKVVATVKVVGLTNDWGNVFVSKSTYNGLFKELLSGFDYSIALLSDDSKTNEKFINYCETFNNSGHKFTIQMAATPILDQFGDVLDSVSEVLLYFGIGFAIFASLLLMNFISTSISYKKREIGILRALGARGSDVFGIFFNESSVIAVINFALATIATFITAGILNNIIITKLGLDLVLLSVGIRQFILIFGVSMLTAFVASFLPVIKIAKKKPVDAINNR